MADYRCYPLMQSSSIGGPAQVINCIDDASAIAKAHEIFREKPFEVWLGARKVYATKARPISG
jgi:hypothetical protein